MRRALLLVLVAACGAEPPPIVAPRPAPSASVTASIDAEAPAPWPRMVAVATNTTCVVHDGRVHCFGNPVGAPDWGHHRDATHVPKQHGFEDAMAIALADDHACVLRRGGSIACWGVVDDGKSGHISHQLRPHYVERTVDAPEQIEGIADGIAIVAGRGFSCALRAKGEVACFGNNAGGALGDASAPGHLDARAVPGIDDATQIAADAERACARRRSGEVWCWGGGGAGTGAAASPPRAIASLAGATRVFVGGAKVCAMVGGALACVDGRSLDAKPSLAKIDAVDMSIAETYRCVVRADGAIACDGIGAYGQLGDAKRESRSPRSFVIADVKATAIAAASDHACALERSGALRCWGANDAGQAGQPFKVTIDRPSAVSGIDDAVRVAMAQRTACAIKKNGDVACWGSGTGGALGGGKDGWDDPDDAYAATAVDDVSGAKDIAGGGSHFCVVGTPVKSGAVTCWGEYATRASGAPCDARCFVPAPIAKIDDAISVSAYDRSTCVVRKSGAVTCWGSAFDADHYKSAPWKGDAPASIPGIANASSVFAGYMLACATRRDGTAACFGADVSSEIDRRKGARGVVAEVQGARDLLVVSVGQPNHAIFKNGEVHAFDWSYRVARDPKNLPPVVMSPPLAKVILTDAAQIAQRQYGACARTRAGKVFCWEGSAAPKATGVDDAVDVAVSEQGAACAVRKSGEVVCWGENASGECGTDPHVVVAPAVVAIPP